jgi:hypothetical protein
MSAVDVRHTHDELSLLRPLDEMATPVRHALTRWLWAHDITPSTVAVGLPIERDDVDNVLVWRERRPDGTVVKRWRYAPHDDNRPWPAEFPAGVAAESQLGTTSLHG